MKPWTFIKAHLWHIGLFILVIVGGSMAMAKLGTDSVFWERVMQVVFIFIAALMGAWLNHTWLTESGALVRPDSNPLLHHPDLWDGAPYVCVHGVKPHEVTHECAHPIAHSSKCKAPTDADRKIRIAIRTT